MKNKRTPTEQEKRKRRNDRKNEISRRNKKTLVEYMGGKCCLCGYNRCLNSLDFHHVKEKNLSIGRNISRQLEDLMEECDLCVLLCKNCHYEVHDDKEAFEERLLKEREAHKQRSAGVKQIKALQKEIQEIEKSIGFKLKKSPRLKRRNTGPKGPMSEEQKAAISATQKKNWAVRKSKESSET